MDYDSHLFIKNAGNEFGEISAIANNEEKYVSFSLKIVWGEFEDKEGKKHKLFHEIRFFGFVEVYELSFGGFGEKSGERSLVFDCTFFLLGGYAENDESEIRIDLRG